MGRLELAAACTNIMALANVVAFQLVHFDALKLVYFVLMALAFATSAPTPRVGHVSTAAALAGLVVMARQAPGDLLGNYGFVGIATAFCAVGMSTLMRGAIMREVKARLASDALNRILEGELGQNRRLRVEAEALMVAAQSASRAKSEFLATISHEIRTPLNGVLGMAQALDRHDMPAVQREQIMVLKDSARSLADIVNDVLDISKIEAGKMEIVAAPFDLRSFCESLDRLYGGLARDKGLGFGFDVDPIVAGWRHGDQARLRQVAANVISNAIKFTDQGSIRVCVSGDGEVLRFAVHDTGVGIPAAQQAQVFTRFAQGDGSVTRKIGGTGLGLAICRELLGLMGGGIGFESEPGVGSSFAFDLLAPAAAAPDLQTEGPAVSGLSRALRVLVVDDNATNRMVLTTLLDHLGLVAETAADGLQAVEAWERERWDAILMDVHMPEMDGLEACRRIRAREAVLHRPRTPIIAVTASILANEAQLYFAAGMDDLIARPIEVGRLIAALETRIPDPSSRLAVVG